MKDERQTPAPITLPGAEFKRALDFVATVVERRNTIPVLGTVLIGEEKGRIFIRGTDLDAEVEATFEAPPEAWGMQSFCVTPRLLQHVVRDAREVTFSWEPGKKLTVGKEADTLVIATPDLTFRYRPWCFPLDFPVMEMPEDVKRITVGEAVLHKAIYSAACCISTEETRYYLNGIFMHQKTGTMLTVATDGHRLALYDSRVDWPLPDMIVPRRAVSILLRALKAGGNREITVEAKDDGTKLRISGDGWSVLTKVIDGTFPDYTRVIPKFPNGRPIQVALTATALRRMPWFGERSQGLSFDPGKQRMTCSAPDTGTAEIPVKIEAPVGQIPFGFNIAYLKGFADRADDKTIRIEGDSAGNPFLVLTSDPALTQVIMPMRV